MTAMTWGERAKGWAWRYRFGAYGTVAAMIERGTHPPVLYTPLGPFFLFILFTAAISPLIERATGRRRLEWVVLYPIAANIIFWQSTIMFGIAERAEHHILYPMLMLTMSPMLAVGLAWKTISAFAGLYAAERLIVSRIPPKRYPAVAWAKVKNRLNRVRLPSPSRMMAALKSVITYIPDHWSGRLNLGPTYWLGSLLLLVVTRSDKQFIYNTLNPSSYNYVVWLFVLVNAFILATFAWQNVGVVRSAQRLLAERKGRKIGEKFWPIMAIVSCYIASPTWLFSAFLRDAPTFLAVGKFLAGIDESGPHKIITARDGSWILFTGDIGKGSAEDFRKTLLRSPDARTVVLESNGGLIDEASRISGMIRRRHLATYVQTGCASACTVIYMAGSPRIIGPRGKLAFHEAALLFFANKQNVANANIGQILRLTGSGVNLDFSLRAYSTPHRNMWTPSTSELLSAHVVTGVATYPFFAANTPECPTP